jgi:dTDP-4-amino-4,6-dideoxygalactose transaminase
MQHAIRDSIPFLDLARESEALKTELRQAFDEVLESGCFLHGAQLAKLEADLAALCGAAHARGVGSGTQALQLLLLAHGIGPGDEVVTTAASFFATAKAVLMVGARPVFADVRRDDYNLDPRAAQDAITSRTRALLVVHLYGRPAEIVALHDIAREAGILLLEDAAHALGSMVEGRPIGAHCDGAALSFYPTKNLGALGDAGAVITNDQLVAERVTAGRFLGSTGKRDVFELDGISGRMDEVQAAFLNVRLRHFARWQTRRAELAARYRAALPDRLLLPPPPVSITDAHHLFVIRHAERDRIAQSLAATGIETQIHYRLPLHRQPALLSSQSLPVTEAWATEVLSLPLHHTVLEDEQDRVIEAVVQAAI